jgi:hypothetical protein
MDAWLDDFDRSELYSFEGRLFGSLAIDPWETEADELRVWLLRWN